ADAAGYGRVYGTRFEDELMVRAAATVILTAEQIVETEDLARQPELTLIPGFLVSAVVHAPGGAWPGSCYPLYDYDADAVRAYLDLAADPERLRAYLDETAARDRAATSEPAIAR
ncbi:MAG: CoA transferase subunit A, partial [Dehalococcoidia bacterium]